MIKNDVSDFGYGAEHFNEYLVYKKGGKKKLYTYNINHFLNQLQRMEHNLMNGLQMNLKTSSMNTTATMEVVTSKTTIRIKNIKMDKLKKRNIQICMIQTIDIR